MKFKKYELKIPNGKEKYFIDIDNICYVYLKEEKRKFTIEDYDGLDFHYEYNDIITIKIGLNNSAIIEISNSVVLDNIEEVKEIYNDILNELEVRN